MNPKLNRVDYMQVGLTSNNTLKAVEAGFSHSYTNVVAVIGDHSGSVNCFLVREDSCSVETVFRTPPGPNAKISCVEVVGSLSGSPKILVAFSSSTIRGYTRKGKQFFGLELNNLTEPIKHLKLRWPNEIFICGNHIFNHYIMNTDSVGSEKNSAIQSKNYYVSPGKITGMVVIEDRPKRRAVFLFAVPILICEDRLLRILKDSVCQYEVETCGIPCTLLSYGNNPAKATSDFYVCYGTLDGKITMVHLNFNRPTMEAKHLWQVPELGAKSPVQCLSAMDSTGELYVGRSDGNVEIWTFSETCDADGNETIDIDSSPMYRTCHNCGESVTSIAVCKEGTLLICSTFTGIVFGLTRTELINQAVNPNMATVNSDVAMKVDILRSECEQLETYLAQEKEKHQEMMSKKAKKQSKMGLSSLPYFAINDSFIFQEDASYLLTLEVEVAIDCVVVQSDIPLDLIDCERNSAVVSFNDNYQSEVLATFRCQANTTRLEVKIRSIEGQFGYLRVYIMTRMTPKSCQVKQYKIKALSLHKRSYKLEEPESEKVYNKLTLKGSFTFHEAHNWLHQCLPEVPERVVSATTSRSVNYNFVSNLTGTILLCTCTKGSLIFDSDSVSTISILKDFITREATKKSISLEMSLDVNELSVSVTLRKLYPKIKALLKMKEKELFTEAIKELNISDPEVASSMLEETNTIQIDPVTATISLDRLYGLITDLYIDYNKLKGNTSKAALNNIKSKIGALVSLIENYASDQHDIHSFVDKLNQFWGIQTRVS